MPKHSAALIALLLAGCASVPAPQPLPALVKVPVTRYVPLPEKLTAACPLKRAGIRTVEAVVAAYNANVTALEQCNVQLDAIRALQGTGVEEVP